MAADLVVSTLIDSNQIAPLVRGVDTIAHDLSIGKLGFLVKDFGRRCLVIDVTVEYGNFANNSKL